MPAKPRQNTQKQKCKLPSVLWRCWLDVRKSIRLAGTAVMRCWHDYLSGARYRYLLVLAYLNDRVCMWLGCKTLLDLNLTTTAGSKALLRRWALSERTSVYLFSVRSDVVVVYLLLSWTWLLVCWARRRQTTCGQSVKQRACTWDASRHDRPTCCLSIACHATLTTTSSVYLAPSSSSTRSVCSVLNVPEKSHFECFCLLSDVFRLSY